MLCCGHLQIARGRVFHSCGSPIWRERERGWHIGCPPPSDFWRMGGVYTRMQKLRIEPFQAKTKANLSNLSMCCCFRSQRGSKSCPRSKVKPCSVVTRRSLQLPSGDFTACKNSTPPLGEAESKCEVIGHPYYCILSFI